MDWQSFVLIPNDDKLLDLNVYIGEPFPRMENGEEIVCEEEMKNKPFTVTINEHQGERSDIPFNVITKQVVSRLASLRFYKMKFSSAESFCELFRANIFIFPANIYLFKFNNETLEKVLKYVAKKIPERHR